MYIFIWWNQQNKEKNNWNAYIEDEFNTSHRKIKINCRKEVTRNWIHAFTPKETVKSK